ncbi:MAG: response regulator transcription factor [Spirochaetales bacterium]|nr:response regulator transcription factor [Spirochaetales bacterium]
MTHKIRIILADDHPVVRDGLKGMLGSQEDFSVVGEAVNGEDLLDLARKVPAEVALVDLRMPVLDGVSAIARLRESCPALRVLVLTTYDSDADIRRAVEAGATGYLLKDAPREELFNAIRQTSRGYSYLSPAVASRLVDGVRSSDYDELSPREVEVLTLVAQGRANKEIARSLRLSEATVKSHLLHIFEKLGAADRTHAVTIAVRKGIIRLE